MSLLDRTDVAQFVDQWGLYADGNGTSVPTMAIASSRECVNLAFKLAGFYELVDDLRSRAIASGMVTGPPTCAMANQALEGGTFYVQVTSDKPGDPHITASNNAEIPLTLGYFAAPYEPAEYDNIPIENYSGAPPPSGLQRAINDRDSAAAALAESQTRKKGERANEWVDRINDARDTALRRNSTLAKAETFTQVTRFHMTYRFAPVGILYAPPPDIAHARELMDNYEEFFETLDRAIEDTRPSLTADEANENERRKIYDVVSGTHHAEVRLRDIASEIGCNVPEKLAEIRDLVGRYINELVSPFTTTHQPKARLNNMAIRLKTVASTLKGMITKAEKRAKDASEEK